MPNSYLSPQVETKAVPGKGYGAFVRMPVRAGERLMVWGGRIVMRETLEQVSDAIRSLSIQVEEDLFLVPLDPPEQADYVNHSCLPNAGLDGQIVLVALRDIAPGEEICFDYAMCDGCAYDEFECTCGAPNCRGRVTGQDWQKPELWVRYAGHFSPYLQKRIDRLRTQCDTELLL